MQITFESLHKNTIDDFLDKGLVPSEQGIFIQDKTGLVVYAPDHQDDPEGKLRNRLKYNPLNQIVSHIYSVRMPKSFEKLCHMKSNHYPNFYPEPFMQMMWKFERANLAGYSILTADVEEASVIPLVMGNKNAMAMGFFWNHSHTKHRKLCIGIKAMYHLIKFLPMIGIDNLFLRGGTLQYKTIFKPELRIYGS